MSDWKSVAISPAATLGEAILKVDQSALQFALVVGDGDHLLGAVTDGDIRRAIIRGAVMGTPVTQVMNATPKTLPVTTSGAAQLQQMRIWSIRHLPLVDDAGRIVGLTTLAEQFSPRAVDNRVVLMAGGLGSRLAPLTDNCPKPMLKVGEKPLLETIIENFAAQGFRHFSITLNYLADMICDHFGDGSKWGVEIDYVRETTRLGTAGALSLLPEKPSQPIIVMNADLLTKVSFQEMLEFHAGQNALATMGVREYEYQIPYGVVNTTGHDIIDVEEKPTSRYFVNGGLYILSPEAIDLIPREVFFDMPSLFSILINDGKKTCAFPVREYWLDIGHVSDFERANIEYLKHFP